NGRTVRDLRKRVALRRYVPAPDGSRSERRRRGVHGIRRGPSVGRQPSDAARRRRADGRGPLAADATVRIRKRRRLGADCQWLGGRQPGGGGGVASRRWDRAEGHGEYVGGGIAGAKGGRLPRRLRRATN